MPDSLSDPLHRLTHAYTSRLREIILEQGISLPITHIRALKAICGNQHSTAQSIAARMRRDKAQITRVLKELFDGELIVKEDNPDDRRSQLLKPTAEGRKIVRKVKTLEARVMGQMTQKLKLDEVKQFILLANKMAAGLGHQTEVEEVG
jgi:DNA-binding MarR family transcriptional regulator